MPWRYGSMLPNSTSANSTRGRLYPSPTDTSSAIHRKDLSGDERRVFHEEQGGARDVLRRAAALKRGLGNDLVLQCLVDRRRPHDRSRRNAVDSDFWS